MTIGEKIKEFRKRAGFTQKKLAEECGVAEITIRQYESSKRQPRYEQLQIIAQALDVHIFDFLDDDYFDAATNDEPDAAEKENLFLNEKLQAIIDNQELSNEEKAIQIQEYETQLNIITDLHLKHVESGRQVLLNAYYNQLNFLGKDKAIEQLEMLTKIPEYQKNDD